MLHLVSPVFLYPHSAYDSRDLAAEEIQSPCRGADLFRMGRYGDPIYCKENIVEPEENLVWTLHVILTFEKRIERN